LPRRASVGLHQRPLPVGCDWEPSLGRSAASTSCGPGWPRSGIRWLQELGSYVAPRTLGPGGRTVAFYSRTKVIHWMPQETCLTGDGAAVPGHRGYGAPLRFAISAAGRFKRSEVAATPHTATGGRTWRVRLVVARDGLARSCRWVATVAWAQQRKVEAYRTRSGLEGGCA
jgi:hypothetical protein